MVIRLGVLILLAVLLLPVSAGAVDASKPSIRILSPNGGESFEVNAKKTLSVTWEAVNMPATAQVCIGVVLEDHARIHRDTTRTDLSLVNTFTCVPAKNGKGKASEKMLEVYNDIHSQPDEYAIVATVITETPYSGIDYLGRPYTSTKINQIARDVSDTSFTIKALKDKKAAMLEVFEGEESWEAGVVYEKDAIKTCQNSGFANSMTVVRCMWKGKEIYNNTPKEGRKLYVVVYDATRSVGQKAVSTASAAKKFCTQYVTRYGSATSCQWGNTMIKEAGGDITLPVPEKKKKVSTTPSSSSEKAEIEQILDDLEHKAIVTKASVMRAANQAIGLALLLQANSIIDSAENYLYDGNFDQARAYAKIAKEKIEQAEDSI